jgi:predicted ATPase
VTSRAPLQAYGEHQFPVPPLAVPPPAATLETTPDVASLARYPAVELFVQRARAVQPRFVLTPENAAAVAAITVLLEGLPHAIELTAARVAVMTPQAILARLAGPEEGDTDPAAASAVPAQALRSTLAWSYGLLPPDEQRLFERLSVFENGFTLLAADVVCGSGPGLSEIGSPVADGLASLIDKSLLRRDEEASAPEGERRFRMLETIREYARGRLEAGGEMGMIRRQHAAFFLAFAESFGDDAGGAGALEEDYLDLRAALRWSVENREPEMALRLARALFRFWTSHNRLSEAGGWIERTLQITGSLGERAADLPTAGRRLGGDLAEAARRTGIAGPLDRLRAWTSNRRSGLPPGEAERDGFVPSVREAGKRPPSGLVAGALRDLAAVARRQGNLRRAAELLADAEALLDARLGERPTPVEGSGPEPDEGFRPGPAG